jgi:hypothetical protein
MCGRTRSYKSERTRDKSATKLCHSCANSVKAGGTGWSSHCIDCGAEKDYPKSASLCKDCHNKRTLIYHRDIYRFNKYNVTREWYEENAKGGCSICKTKLNPYSANKRERGHIDHDHKTDKARGVLCDLCNKGLGQFKDSVENLKAAIEYLERAEENNGIEQY